MIEIVFYDFCRASHDPPKIHYATILPMRVPAARILNDSWWMAVCMLPGLQFHGMNSDKGMITLYEKLLPFLLGSPVEHAVVEARAAGDEGANWWRTPQAATTDYYRSVREAFYYTIRIKAKMDHTEAKLFFFLLRRQYFSAILHDVKVKRTESTLTN